MPGEAALLLCAVKHPSCDLALAAMSTLGAGLTRIRFLLQPDIHADSLSFVREHLPNMAMRPLMELLIVFAANIQVLPNSAHIAKNDGLYPISVKGRDKVCRLFVLTIFDLVSQFLELPLFGLDKFLATARAFLLPVNARLEFRFQLVLILPL
jgi:hypothetical protein